MTPNKPTPTDADRTRAQELCTYCGHTGFVVVSFDDAEGPMTDDCPGCPEIAQALADTRQAERERNLKAVDDEPEYHPGSALSRHQLGTIYALWDEGKIKLSPREESLLHSALSLDQALANAECNLQDYLSGANDV